MKTSNVLQQLIYPSKLQIGPRQIHVGPGVLAIDHMYWQSTYGWTDAATMLD